MEEAFFNLFSMEQNSEWAWLVETVLGTRSEYLNEQVDDDKIELPPLSLEDQVKYSSMLPQMTNLTYCQQLDSECESIDSDMLFVSPSEKSDETNTKLDIFGSTKSRKSWSKEEIKMFENVYSLLKGNS